MSHPIPQNWDVPAIFRERMGARAGRQRIMIDAGHLLVILHDVPDPKEPDVRSAKLFWRKPDGSWKSTGSGAATIAPLRAHLETFVKVTDDLEERVEKAKTASDYFAVLHDASPLLRTVRNMSKALQDARDAAKDDKDLIGVRDVAQEVERAAELIHGYAKDGLDFTIAKGAEDNARATEHVLRTGHQLNLLAALFFPITAVGSLLGMNLLHGFETWNAPYAFWAVAAACFVLGFLVRATLPKPPA